MQKACWEMEKYKHYKLSQFLPKMIQKKLVRFLGNDGQPLDEHIISLGSVMSCGEAIVDGDDDDNHDFFTW